MGASSPPEQEKQKKMEVMDATLNGFLGRFALNETNRRKVSVLGQKPEGVPSSMQQGQSFQQRQPPVGGPQSIQQGQQSQRPEVAGEQGVQEEQCNHDFHASVVEKELNRIAPSVFSEEYKP